MRDVKTLEKTPTNNQDTSIESRDILDSSGKSNKYRKKIYEHISLSPNGKTCDEVEVDLGIRHQTASCFIRFLTKDGYLYNTGKKRITRSNRKAIVWAVKK